MTKSFFLKNKTVFLSALLLISLPAVSSENIRVDTFKDISECTYSSRSSSIDESCDVLAKAAFDYSKNITWPFKTLNECYHNYGVSKCLPNNGYLSVEPSGFAYIDFKNGVSLPYFLAISLGRNRIVLPNGYEITKGRSFIPGEIGDEEINNIRKPKSLSSESCIVVNGKDYCDKRSNLLNLPIKYKSDVLISISRN